MRWILFFEISVFLVFSPSANLLFKIYIYSHLLFENPFLILVPLNYSDIEVNIR